ncbi:unnamed protein product, partial [Chrysoparadoxa australica]
LQAAIKRAADQGLSASGVARLKRIVLEGELRETFRASLGHDPPAAVEPMRVTMKQGAEPLRAKARKQKPEARKWLCEFMRLLVAAGLVYVNAQAVWASCVMARPKPGGKGYRMVGDFRPPNSVTIQCAYPMPLLEEVMGFCEGARCFFTFDGLKGFWQFPLAEDCQELFTFISEDGLWTPTRVPQGSMNAAVFYQSVMEKVLAEEMNHICVNWLDDTLGWGRGSTEDEAEVNLLDNLERVLRKLFQAGIKLSAEKAEFYLTHAKWCGKIVTGDGIRHDPARVQGLVDMEKPKTAGHLMQFVCSVNWMRTHLPGLAQVMAPLQQLQQQKLADTTRRSKPQADRLTIEPEEWTDDVQRSWQETKQLLQEAVMLAHPKQDWDLLAFTDSSDLHWGLMLTQVPREALAEGVPVEEMRHEPLAFQSGSFRGPQLHWSATDKEAYPIVMMFQRFEHLLWKQVHLYCDHKTLAYIF